MQSQSPIIKSIEKSPSKIDDKWFRYSVRVQPHHTDYAGVVWHGSYINWMEEARIEYLHSIGIDHAKLTSLGCDLPVVDLSVRYHRPMRMGMVAVVRTCMKSRVSGIRLDWDYTIQSLEEQETYVTAQLTLVVINTQKGTIMQHLPLEIKNLLRTKSS
ncbi:MAG: thioesterase family protein [Nostoc sp. DedQUE08]|uniref:acyl-CoA thioesterase n=1 Tax=Nostoc sp. DedQUE08 TaxID=3075393 RepID=UPI002AD2973A|nr:thioesterase family protein [Nostoc sp. DedQUE08]MDZ8068516.1 thioesterase family protein [Nostoc sp. DedQUE08]